MRRFLVKIATDPRIQRIVWRPATIVSGNPESDDMGVELFYKPFIVCDICNARVNAGKKDEEGLPVGYVLADTKYVYEVVCEDCRRRYFGRLSVYDNLEEAERG
jgi:uncharacterized protein with PIN domain